MNCQFSNIECRNMLFNPLKVPDGENVFKIFPKLSSYKIFKKSPGPDIDNNLVMLFIFFMFDQSTPYRTKFSDVLKRKIEVAHDVGFVLTPEGIFEPPIEQMLKGGNAIVNAKIVEFVRMHRNFKYSYLVAIESSYYKMFLEVQEGDTSKLKQLNTMLVELEETMKQILNDDNNPFIKETVLRYIEEERLQIRPEDIAMKLANNEQPFTLKEIR